MNIIMSFIRSIMTMKNIQNHYTNDIDDEAILEAAHRNMQLPVEDLEFTINAYPLNNIK